jgi:hypothetical protein
MTGGFPNRSLEDNKKLMLELKKFRKIIFDKEQRYGVPSYEPVPLEKELGKVANQLAEVIYEQLNAVNLLNQTTDQLMELHKDYQAYCLYGKINYSGNVDKARSRVRCQILAKTKELKDVESKVKLLCFITRNSNCGDKENKEAEDLLDKLGFSDEEIHIRVFGERPK